MSKEYKEAIALTRSNGIGNEMRKHALQAARITDLAQKEDFTIREYFAYSVRNKHGEGFTDMMRALLTYLHDHPEVKYLLVENLNRVCRSASLYGMFDAALATLGVSIEAPEFYCEEQNV